MIYLNDNDGSCVRWLKGLQGAGLIGEGEVDRRQIEFVKGDELGNYRQCHFFAGIGGWVRALQLAGWPDDVPVWTGSCPCQPFSTAGKGEREDDPRHLWPQFRRLIEECHPPIVFGEQVESKAGRKWLAGVHADLEALGYIFAAADLCAASVASPHRRQRLYWVGISDSAGPFTRELAATGSRYGSAAIAAGAVDGLADTTGKRSERDTFELLGQGAAGTVVDMQWGGQLRSEDIAIQGDGGNGVIAEATSFWNDFGIVECADGKARRVESGVFPLAYGVSGRVAKLRGLGNAIVPQVAAVFVRSVMETLGIAGVETTPLRTETV